MPFSIGTGQMLSISHSSTAKSTTVTVTAQVAKQAGDHKSAEDVQDEGPADLLGTSSDDGCPGPGHSDASTDSDCPPRLAPESSSGETDDEDLIARWFSKVPPVSKAPRPPPFFVRPSSVPGLTHVNPAEVAARVSALTHPSSSLTAPPVAKLNRKKGTHTHAHTHTHTPHTHTHTRTHVPHTHTPCTRTPCT